MKKTLLPGYGLAPVLLLWILAALSCSGRDRAVTRYNEPGSETISIGVAYPRSQWENDWYLWEALELAVSRVNESGGVLGKPLSLVFRDDLGDSHIAQEIAETFYDSGITAVVGHWASDVCYYVEDIYEERQIVMMTPSATSLALFDRDYQYIYRTIANNQQYAEALADYAKAEGIRSPAIFYAEDTYGIDLARMVEKELADRGIPVADRVTSITAANVGELLRRWRAFGCDALVMTASYQYSTEPIKRIRDAGARMPVFTEVFNNTGFSDLMAGYLENLYGIVYGREDMSESFVADFQAVYGRMPDTYEVAGYEAVRLLAEAMNAEGSVSSDAIVRYLRNLRDYPSVMGPVSYNAATHEFEGWRMRVRQYAEYGVK